MFMVVVLPQPDGPSSAVNDPCGDLEIEVVDRADVAEVLGQVLELDGCHAHCLIAPKVRPRTR